MTSIAIEQKPLTAYNLTVKDYHTYFVAANDEADPVWVHNQCSPELRAALGELKTSPDALKRVDELKKLKVDDDAIIKLIDEGALFISKHLKELQSQFDQLASAHLIPEFRKLDPGLTFGFKGSFKTGVVANPNKRDQFGQVVDLNNFDIDFFINSDVLHKQLGNSLKANPGFREILANTPGFEGLRPNKAGFTIKFNPSEK